MKKKDTVKSLIREFHYRELSSFIPREGLIPIEIPKVVTLIGPRRSGKTFRLYQIISEVLKTHSKDF